MIKLKEEKYTKVNEGVLLNAMQDICQSHAIVDFDEETLHRLRF